MALLRTYIYPGLTAEQAKQDHIKQYVTKLIKAALPNRIVAAVKWDMSFEEMTPINGVPILKVIVSCRDEDQYCSGCGDYGCPGGC